MTAFPHPLRMGTLFGIKALPIASNGTDNRVGKPGLVKIIGKNHQFLGINNAIAQCYACVPL
jgi:hypothetical protein